MDCCRSQGIEERFNQRMVARTLTLHAFMLLMRFDREAGGERNANESGLR